MSSSENLGRQPHQDSRAETDAYKALESRIRASDFATLSQSAKDMNLKYLTPFITSTVQYDPIEIQQYVAKGGRLCSVEPWSGEIVYQNPTSGVVVWPVHHNQIVQQSNSESCLSHVSPIDIDDQVLGWINQFGISKNEALYETLLELKDQPPLSIPKVPIIGFRSYPGVVYLPGFLTLSDQFVLANECLRYYINSPNQSNLSRLQMKCPHWTGDEKCFLEDAPVETLKYKPQGLIDVARGSHVGSVDKSDFAQLRWVTLGYQYDWASRTYDGYQEFPEPLRELTVTIVEAVWSTLRERLFSLEEEADTTRLVEAVIRGWRPTGCGKSTDGMKSCNTADEISSQHDERNDGITSWYNPDCAILNLYRNGDRLRGHTDDVEREDGLPLVSISLGQPCIFVIGGKTRCDSTLTPIVLRSGDVLILGGVSRLAYHGVPKLLGFFPNKTRQNGKGRKKLQIYSRAKTFTTTKRQVLSPIGLEFTPTMANLFRIDNALDQKCESWSLEGTNSKTKRSEIGSSFHRLVSTLGSCRLNLSIRQVKAKC